MHPSFAEPSGIRTHLRADQAHSKRQLATAGPPQLKPEQLREPGSNPATTARVSIDTHELWRLWQGVCYNCTTARHSSIPVVAAVALSFALLQRLLFRRQHNTSTFLALRTRLGKCINESAAALWRGGESSKRESPNIWTAAAVHFYYSVLSEEGIGSFKRSMEYLDFNM
jgi:hypothetical protein